MAVRPGRSGRLGGGNPILASGAARLISLPVTAIATLLSTRIVIQHYGIAVFDGFSLVVSMMALLSVNDLGAGAAVTNAVAGSPRGDAYPERVALTAARVSLVAAMVAGTASVLITGTDSWTGVAGAAVYSNVAFGAATLVICFSFPPLLGQSVLLGANKNHVYLVLQALLAPLILGVIAILVLVDARGSLVIIVPAGALFAVALSTSVVSARVVPFPWVRILRHVAFRRRYTGASIRSVATPMLVIQLATPIALQADRIILSHFGTASQLADYSVSVQLFAPVTVLVTSVAQPLWPMFTAARENATAKPPLRKILTVIVLGALATCGAIVALAAPLGRLVGSAAIDLGVLLPFANALVVLTYAVTFPIAMAILDGPGRRLAATVSVLALPVNIGLSILFIPQLGASSPLFATAVVTLVMQTAPFAWYFRVAARRRRPRHAYGIPRDGDLPAHPALGAEAGQLER
ncbi:MAG: lipopolysaccharide biosynthesis protein [Jatrophihabitantaceae bacterium]